LLLHHRHFIFRKTIPLKWGWVEHVAGLDVSEKKKVVDFSGNIVRDILLKWAEVTSLIAL